MSAELPILLLARSGSDPRRVLAFVPESERHHGLHIGQLVVVRDGPKTRRRGCIEALGDEGAVVRYVD